MEVAWANTPFPQSNNLISDTICKLESSECPSIKYCISNSKRSRFFHCLNFIHSLPLLKILKLNNGCFLMIAGVLHKAQLVNRWERYRLFIIALFAKEWPPSVEDLSLETTCNLFIVRVIEILYLTIHTINLHSCTRPGIVY